MVRDMLAHLAGPAEQAKGDWPLHAEDVDCLIGVLVEWAPGTNGVGAGDEYAECWADKPYLPEEMW